MFFWRNRITKGSRSEIRRVPPAKPWATQNISHFLQNMAELPKIRSSGGRKSVLPPKDAQCTTFS